MANLSNINGKFVVEQTTGYVGVGTEDPNFLIEAAGANSEIALNSTSASIYRLRSTSSDSFIITKNGVGDRLTINGGGDATFSGTLAAGATTISSATNLLLTLNPTTGNYGGILFQYGGATKGLSYYNSGMMIYGGEAGVPIRLQAGGQYCFHADATNQNVHIGSTTDTSYKLAVNGTFNTSGNATFAGEIRTANRLAIKETYFGYSSGYKVIQVGESAATKAISLGYNPSGNTSGSFSGNEILIPNNIRLIAPAASNSGYYGLMMLNSSNKMLLGSSNYLIENNYIMALDPATKNVGIGTAAPLAKLHLEGTGDMIRVVKNVNNYGPQMDLILNQTSPSNGDVAGYINIGAKDNSGTPKYWGSIRAVVDNIFTELGGFEFYTRAATDFNKRLKISAQGKVIVYQKDNVSGFYLDGGNTRLYANGGGGTDYRGIECNSSGAWSWGETGSSNYFAKKVGIGTSTPYSILDINGVLTIGPASEDPNFTVTSTDVSTIAGGSLELVQGFGGTTAAGDTIVFTYAAQSWKAFQYEYCISAAYGLSKGGGGGYNNNGMTSYYYVTTNQGSNVNVTSVTSNSGGSGNQSVIVTITGNFGIHPCVSFKYTQSGGDGAPRADRATLAFNS